MSWESTTSYYQIINRETNRRLGGNRSAKILLDSVDFEEIVRLQKSGDWAAAGNVLAQSARKLEAGGADFLLLATNTMHKVAPAIEQAVSIPLLHIVDATAEAIKQQGLHTVGLLGTRFTMSDGFYTERMAAQGVNTIVPSEAEQNEIHRIIFEELCRNQIQAASAHYFQNVIGSLKTSSAPPKRWRAAAAAVCELRERVVDASITLGPRWRATHGAETTTLLSTGLEDLRPYFVAFLPQLVLVCTVTPAALGVILLLDFWSAVIALLVIPLIPLFMVLIGRFTQSASDEKLASMKRLSAQLLDLISGLPTLRALGRERAPRPHLRALGEANTKATMSTLRVAFLSGGVLEFLTTLSVALVAVEVGMRLVFGHMSLFDGLAVIMLAPEVFEPLRQVGAQFHASANGVTASRAAFDIIEGGCAKSILKKLSLLIHVSRPCNLKGR